MAYVILPGYCTQRSCSGIIVLYFEGMAQAFHAGYQEAQQVSEHRTLGMNAQMSITAQSLCAQAIKHEETQQCSRGVYHDIAETFRRPL